MAWSTDRIKRSHDEHVHYVDGKPVVHPPCPGCVRCKCPVHRADPHAIVPNEVTANEIAEG